MDKKWTCPICGAENGEKDALKGVCWKCDAPANVEVFDPEPESEEASSPESESEEASSPESESEEAHDGQGDTRSMYVPPKRPGCMLWLAGLVAALVLLGVVIYFIKGVDSVPIDDGQTADVTPGNNNGPKTDADTLCYVDGVNVSLYAPLDGYKPESMARVDDVLYFTQDGGLYCLKDGEVSQVDLDGWEAQIVRVWQNQDVLVLTRPKELDGAYRYTILRVYENSYEDDLLSEHFIAGYVEKNTPAADFDMYPTDFAISPSGGNLWLITRHFENRAPDNTEYTLDCCLYQSDTLRYKTETLETKAVFEYMVSDKNTPYMLFDADGNLYITGPEDGFIRILRKDERVVETFAGQTSDLPGVSGAVIGVHGRNDSGAVSFVYPTALALDGQYLYVLDDGTVRRIPLDGVPDDGIETLAGNVTDNAQTVSAGATVSGKDALLSTSARSGLVALDDALLLSAPETGVVYTIPTKEG